MIKWPFGKKSANARPAAGQKGGVRAARSGLTRKPEPPTASFRGRALFLAVVLAIGAVVLGWKAFTLQLVESDFLRGQGDERFTRVASVVAHRGSVTDRSGEPLAVSLQKELADPLGLDGLFIGMPEAELPRRAHLINGLLRRPRVRDGWQSDLADVFRRGLRVLGVDLAEFRAALFPFDTPFDFNAEEVVRACIPAANGQFTARSLARLYAMIAEGGALDGVRLLSDVRVQTMGEIRNRTRDNVLFIPMHWRLGYHRVFALGARAPAGFGHYGYGGSGAFCDPSRRLAVALTVNGGTGTPTGDSRMPRLAGAAIRCVDRLR